MVMISFGVILSYGIQFFIPIQIMFPRIRNRFELADRHPLAAERIFRVLVTLATFSVAMLVPNLGLLISLIGAVCSTSLALVFPLLIEYFVLTRNDKSLDFSTLVKNILLLSFAIVGFLSGGYESLRQIVKLYQ